MELKKITKNEYDKFFSLLESDFCLDERKTKINELKAFDDSNFSPNFIYDNQTLVGYICFWEFEKFLYIEHFAILNSMRGTGQGSKFLKEFSEKFNKPIILEVELPENEVAIKRIKFYERLGYHLNNFPYTQPAYQPESKPVEMFVMSYGTTLSKSDFSAFTKTIKKIVYNQ